MDQSPKKSPATPKRRTSRRLVQSTLFPVKPPEPVENGDPKKDDNDEKNDQDEELCGSQTKRKRKTAAPKKTPPVKAPKKSGKRSANSTPTKKNGKDVVVEDGPLIMPDLRLESKLREAEMSRIWTKEGRQLHPFFACSKLAKKSQETSEVEGSSGFKGSKEIDCAPIHVFENTQDDAVFLDWRNWTFCEETGLTSGPHLECMPSIFEGSVECLDFDKVSSVSQPCKSSTFQNTASLDQCRMQVECAHETSSAVPQFLASEQVRCYQHISKEVEDCEVGLYSEYSCCMKKSDIEQQNTFLEERGMSDVPACCDQPENCLWTYKYQPKNAREVCGNNESVKFLSEWLRSWYERDPQTNEDDYRQDIDYKCTQSDSESEDNEVLKKKNVLLVTGPIGSGKSAAIYACAKEQGIKVLELSASECRTGASVKQRFGEAFKSRKFQRSVANAVGSQNKLISTSCFVEANGTTGQDLDDDDDVELIPISDDECHDATGTSVTFSSKDDNCKDKLVILFEDVDITFLEEGGFISAIQQIAKTANGPIILTSNSPNPVLPDSFDRLQVHFMLPSSTELYSHAYMVCAAERVSIPPYLLHQFIECCRGDVRKIIMHLQFWCQGRSFKKDTKMMQQKYGSLLFDVEAGHQMLPKLLPWDLPSQLSVLVEKEITKSLSMMEQGSTPMEANDNTEVQQCSLDMAYSEMEKIDAKKVAMLDRNGYTHECSEYTATDTAPDFSNDSSTPFPNPRRHVRRMHGVVLSSDSEDDFMKNGYPTVTDNDTNHEVLRVDSLSEMLLFPGVTNTDRGFYDCLTADEFQMSEMCNFADISCVPESSFVPETQMDNESDFLSQTMSTGHFATAINGVFLGDELPVEDNNGIDMLSQTVSSAHFANTMAEVRFNEDLPAEVNNPAQLKSGLQIDFENMGNNCDAILEYSHQELEDPQSEFDETVARAYQLMDECSRMDFNKGRKFIRGQKPPEVSDLVQDSWNKLREWRNDLRQYVASEKDASQMVMLAYRMSNLISETDMLFSKCQPLMSDSVDPSMILGELDSFSWCDERLQLASTIAQHGFCFYAKGILLVGSNVGFTRRVDVDLASEMLANTANMTALGKLVGQGTRTSMTSDAGINSENSQPKVITSEIKSLVFDAIQSIVPTRFKLTLRGTAYIEYLSSLRHISRSEASRLSKGVENTTRRRRRRVAPHYLSSGAKMLSPEDISLLDQYNLCGKTITCSD